MYILTGHYSERFDAIVLEVCKVTYLIWVSWPCEMLKIHDDGLIPGPVYFGISPSIGGASLELHFCEPQELNPTTVRSH